MIARCAIAIAVLVVASSTVPPAISAAAQTYPSRPITIIAPYAIGGTTDLIGRIMADRWMHKSSPPGGCYARTVDEFLGWQRS
jgi:tripartite-type tricarboxylate transporter receptor subunit TctC